MSDETAPDAAGPPIVRRLATILCADVAGYSQMMGLNEERTVRVFRGHREIFESLVKLHRGRVFNTAGDALLVEFNSAVEAVRCATEIQAALSTRNEQLAREERMLFRMGINLGDVIVQGEDLLGDGVNVAARIQTATEPGGICISGSVYDQIQNKLSLDFKLLGEQVYKNIARPVRTYTINEGAAVTAPARRPSAKLPAAIAAAVLVAAGAGYWGYQQYEGQRAERARLEAQMAAQLAAQKQATEQAQRAAEEARRDAQAQAQKREADEALRRAQDERQRLEQDRKQLENDKRAAEAAKKQAEASLAKAPTAPPVAPSAPKTTATYDGSYNGQLCNTRTGEPKPNCWSVALFVRNGSIEGNWPSPTGKPSKAAGTVAPDGTIALNLSGWSRDDKPAEAVLAGHASRDGIAASGQWRGGVAVTGNWKRGQAVAAAPATVPAPKVVTRYDGTYAGKLCNNPRDDARRSCWQADLMVRYGVVESNWRSRSGNDSGARGKVADDGALELKLNGWNREAKPVDGSIAGRVAGDAISASGRWADGGPIAGEWKRTR